MNKTLQIAIESNQTIVTIDPANSISINQFIDGYPTTVFPPKTYRHLSFEIVFNYQNDACHDDYSSWSNLWFINNSIVLSIDGEKYAIENLPFSQGYRTSFRLNKWLGLAIKMRHRVAWAINDGSYNVDDFRSVEKRVNLYYAIRQDIRYRGRRLSFEYADPFGRKYGRYFGNSDYKVRANYSISISQEKGPEINDYYHVGPSGQITYKSPPQKNASGQIIDPGRTYPYSPKLDSEINLSEADTIW